MLDQLNFFGADPSLPQGFRYQPNVISTDDERALLELIQNLPFKQFEFHGHTGQRRVVSFGWRYDFATETLGEAAEIPAFLLPVRDAAAHFAGLTSEQLQHILVTEYSPGAAIGWHRDKGVFGEVVGISLLSPCTFRLRRTRGTSWERFSITAEPRSAYLMTGPSRTEWEHSIPAVDSLRYSITFRNLSK